MPVEFLGQAWTAREPFDHTGPHYTFADFVSDVFPVQAPRPPLSFGGSSPAGRTDVPKIQVAFRPIIAPTEQKAWAKAHDIVSRIEDRVAANGGALSRRRPLKNPENTGSQRLLAIAAEGERFDRALWTRTAAVTGGGGNSNALVGTPDTVARAILDYIDVGDQVIPIVREEVAKRDKAAAA
jgi:alkanesulfonate monooxygenase